MKKGENDQMFKKKRNIIQNKDDITEAVHALDIFTKNWCMNCKETEKKNEPVFHCKDCEFNGEHGICIIKLFANNHEHHYDLYNFGSIRR